MVYVHVRTRVSGIYVKGIADAGSVGETKNAPPDCDGEVSDEAFDYDALLASAS